MNTTETDKSTQPVGGEQRADFNDQSKNQSAAEATPQDETKKRAKAPAIEDLGQLIRAIYLGKFRRANLRKAELKAMRNSPGPTDAEREEYFRLAQSDRLLEKTRQLMLLGVRTGSPVIPGQIREFARDVLARHPLYRSEVLAGVLENHPDALLESEAVATVLSMDCASLVWSDDEEPFTKKQCEQCRTNAVHCLLLVFWTTRGTPLERIQRHLHNYVWKSPSWLAKSDGEKLYALVSARDPAAASVTFSVFEKEISEQKRRVENAIRSEERAQLRAGQLEEQSSGFERDLANARAHLDRLQKELIEANQQHAIDKVHWNDDYEQLRGQMLRRLKEEVALLDEGLHALRRDPPKVHVMVDHAERAIDGLKREMEGIRQKG